MRRWGLADKEHRRPATSILIIFGALVTFVLIQFWIGSSGVLDNLNDEQFALLKQAFLSNDTNSRNLPKNKERPISSFRNERQIPFHSLLQNASHSFDHSTGSLWSLELALGRATSELKPRIQPIHLEKCSRVAIFLQFGTNVHLLPDLVACTANIVAAANMVAASGEPLEYLHIYLGFIEGHDQRARELQIEFERFSNVNVFVTIVPNAGADVGQFLAQFTQTNQTYDMVMKLHTKTDPIWRERMVESLCASPEQVISTWRLMDEAQAADQRMILAPLGTMFSRHFNLSDIFPHIARKYQYHNRTDTEPIGGLPRGVPIWGFYTVNYMNRIYRKLGGTGNRILGGKRRLYRDREHWIVAGTSFWANWKALYPKGWKEGKVYEDYVEERLTPGYKDNYGMEHAVERLFPSILRQREGVLCEIQPAPRIFLLFHFLLSAKLEWDETLTTVLRDTTQSAFSRGIQGMVLPWTAISKSLMTGLLNEKEFRLPFFFAIPLHAESSYIADVIQDIKPLMRMSNYVKLHQRPLLMILVEPNTPNLAETEKAQSKIRQLTFDAKNQGFAGIHTILYPCRVSEESGFDMDVKDLAKHLGADASLFMLKSQNMTSGEQIIRLKDNHDEDGSNDDMDGRHDDDDGSSDDMDGRPGDREMLSRLADTRIQYTGITFDRDEKPSAIAKVSDMPTLIRRGLRAQLFQMAADSSREVQASFHFVDPGFKWQDPSEFELALPDSLAAIQRSLMDITCRDVVHNTF